MRASSFVKLELVLFGIARENSQYNWKTRSVKVVLSTILYERSIVCSFPVLHVCMSACLRLDIKPNITSLVGSRDSFSLNRHRAC